MRQWAPMALKAGCFFYILGDPMLASDRNEVLAFRGLHARTGAHYGGGGMLESETVSTERTLSLSTHRC